MAASTGSEPLRTSETKLSTKVIQMTHKLSPGNLESWKTFSGEFKSVIDSNALTALKRGRPYTLADAQRLSPMGTQTQQAELAASLNESYEDCMEYIYRNLYGNIKFDVPSHGPSLRNFVAQTYEDTRDGGGLWRHLQTSHDVTFTDRGQERIEQVLTPEKLRERMSAAVNAQLFASIVYAIHDDWLKLTDNQGKHPVKLMRQLLRQIKTLANTEIALMGCSYLSELNKAGDQPSDGMYASIKAFVEALALEWPTLSAGSLNAVYPPRPGGPGLTPLLGGPPSPVIRFGPKTNKCNTCDLFTCTAGANADICQAVGTNPMAMPKEATKEQCAHSNGARMHAQRKKLKTMKGVG